jgi:hypothetical protein
MRICIHADAFYRLFLLKFENTEGLHEPPVYSSHSSPLFKIVNILLAVITE